MSSLADDFAFLRGLALGLIGLVIWITANSFQRFAIILGPGESSVLLAIVYLGAVLTFGGPLLFWVVKPAMHRIG